MTFLSGHSLHKAIRKILNEPKCECAVAFWGSGIQNIIYNPSKLKIVCNLQAGGTNPGVIRDLKANGARIKHSPTLHAKVYIGAENAIITSANASSNGLALEGVEQSHWEETGVLVDGDARLSALEWFDGIWDSADEVTEPDLEIAKRKYNFRRNIRPPVKLSAYDVSRATDEGKLPFIMWVNNESKNAVINTEEIEQTGIEISEKTSDLLLHNSERIESEGDREFLKPGNYILFWYRDNISNLSSSGSLSLHRLGKIIPRAIKIEGHDTETTDVVLWNKAFPLIDVKESNFVNAFNLTIKPPEFKLLRQIEHSPWYAPQMPLLPAFWTKLKENYMT